MTHSDSNRKRPSLLRRLERKARLRRARWEMIDSWIDRITKVIVLVTAVAVLIRTLWS